jgi:hypothetical protein
MMSRTERAKLYEIFANILQDLGILYSREKPILSDEGSDLQKYGQQHPRHFLCSRHILEGFGSATSVARIVHRLLFSPTKEHDCSCGAQADSDLEHLGERGLVTPSAIEKFIHSFGADPSDL